MEYKGELKGFPKEIVEKMLYYQAQQGNPKDITVFENNNKTDKNRNGFTWEETPEGLDFWYNIIFYKKFALFFEKYPKHKNTVKFWIYSKKIVADLSKYGVIPRKTHFTYFPDISEELWPHFIRGVFDGDGSISFNEKKGPSICIVGNITLIKKIQDIFIDKCKINRTKLHKAGNAKENIKSLIVHGSYQVTNIKNFLYKDSKDLYLKRKKEKFDKIKIKKKNLVYK